MKLLILTAALLTAAPALAAPSTAPAAGTEARSTAAATAANDKTRYCVVDAITGSRIPVRVCKSRKEWTAVGIDVTKTRQ